MKNKNYWVISDPHWFDSEIFGFQTARQQFGSVEELDEVMVDRWNGVVSKGDRVYLLGDVFSRKRKEDRVPPTVRFNQLRARLNGRIVLTLGNHDDYFAMQKQGWFDRIELFIKKPDWGLILSHTPLHTDCLYSHKTKSTLKNIHGHLHSQVVTNDLYHNVSVERINFTPVNLEEFRC